MRRNPDQCGPRGKKFSDIVWRPPPTGVDDLCSMMTPGNPPRRAPNPRPFDPYVDLTMYRDAFQITNMERSPMCDTSMNSTGNSRSMASCGRGGNTSNNYSARPKFEDCKGGEESCPIQKNVNIAKIRPCPPSSSAKKPPYPPCDIIPPQFSGRTVANFKAKGCAPCGRGQMSPMSENSGSCSMGGRSGMNTSCSMNTTCGMNNSSRGYDASQSCGGQSMGPTQCGMNNSSRGFDASQSCPGQSMAQQCPVYDSPRQKSPCPRYEPPSPMSDSCPFDDDEDDDYSQCDMPQSDGYDDDEDFGDSEECDACDMSSDVDVWPNGPSISSTRNNTSSCPQTSNCPMPPPSSSCPKNNTFRVDKSSCPVGGGGGGGFQNKTYRVDTPKGRSNSTGPCVQSCPSTPRQCPSKTGNAKPNPAVEKRIAIARQSGQDAASECQKKKLINMQYDHLAKDNFCPGHIQSALEDNIDFNEEAFAFVFGSAEAAPCHKPVAEPISLLDAVLYRVDNERLSITQDPIYHSVDRGNSSPEEQEEKIQKSVKEVEDHFSRLVNSDLNKAISNLLKAEKIYDVTDPNMNTKPSFSCDMVKKETLLVGGVSTLVTTYTGTTTPL